MDLHEVVEGRGPAPRAVLALIGRLPDTSLTVALASGGRSQFGWGLDRHILTDIYDAIGFNTRTTGNWKKGPPNIKLWPRPKPKKPARKDAPTTGPMKVADLFKRFQRR